MKDLEYDDSFPEVKNLESYGEFDLSHLEIGEKVFVSSDSSESSYEWISADLDYSISLEEIR